MDIKELRGLTAETLREKLSGYREELFNLRFQHATAQLENTSRIPQVKKTIARIFTVLKETGKE